MLVRLFTDTDLQIGAQLSLNQEQTNYLNNVLRCKNGENINIFDGKSGEYSARITQISKKKCSLQVEKKIKEFSVSPDLWLIFAPLKKDCTDMVVQKATELGVRKIIPLISKYTVNSNVRLNRWQSQAIEAAEQCRRLDIPQIESPQTLDALLENFPKDRIIFFLNEKGNNADLCAQMRSHPQKAAIMIGPEGGFADEEVKKLFAYKNVCDIFLKNRILRAETAAIAAISCWQALNGDWR